MTVRDILSNIHQLVEMDTFLRNNVQDEENFIYWLAVGVPDGAVDNNDMDVLTYMAQDEECMMDCIKAFNKICSWEGLEV